METTTCIRDINPMASAELSGPCRATLGVSTSFAATRAGCLDVVPVIYGQVEWNEAVLTIGIFRSGSEDGGLFLKALPVPEREAEVLSFRLRAGLSERGIHLLRRGGGEGERGVRGQDYLRLGHAEAAQLLDTVRLPERDGVHAGVERFPGALHAAGLVTGPMPQPYIMTLQPRRLAARRVKR